MAGIVEELNPEEGLRKLSRTGYEYRLIIEGENENSELCFEVVNIKTSIQNAFLIKFTKVKGFINSTFKAILNEELLMFQPSTIKTNTDKGTVSILLCDPDEPNKPDSIFRVENIKTLIKMPKERTYITKDDILSNENYRKAIMPLIQRDYKRNNQAGGGFSLWNAFKQIFQIK